MINIKELLLAYYNFIDSNLIDLDNECFLYDNSTFFFHKVNKNSIINRVNDSLFHEIIKNKYNSIYTLYNNNYYVLLKVNIKENNRDITFEDIINISKTNSYYNLQKNNYFYIWNSKISFIEKYCYDYYNKEQIDFNYYNGLAYLALNLIKSINYTNITYGISYNRFYNIKTLYDLYNVFNIEYGPVVNSFIEYIKHSFFYMHKNVDYKAIFDLPLKEEDYYYLIARLLFPTYYYDLFKEDKIKNEYHIISNRICDYISCIKEMIIEIKKRHNNMSFIDSIVNLL